MSCENYLSDISYAVIYYDVCVNMKLLHKKKSYINLHLRTKQKSYNIKVTKESLNLV